MRDFGSQDVQPQAARLGLRTWLLVLSLLGLMLAGCGSSSGSSNSTRTSARSVGGHVGSIRLIHVRVAGTADQHAAGSDAGLFLTLANDGSATDRLVDVSTTEAAKIVLRDGDGPAEDSISVPIEPRRTASLQDVGGPHLEIVDLARDVSRRTFMPVTFTFAKAGSVTVDVWVQALHPSMTDSASSP